MATGGDGLDPCGNACWGPGIAPALWYAVHSSRQVHSRALAGSAVDRYGWVLGFSALSSRFNRTERSLRLVRGRDQPEETFEKVSAARPRLESAIKGSNRK